ncbi:hypothetical protein ACQ4PT_069258 [Festuca glaucescens]
MSDYIPSYAQDLAVFRWLRPRYPGAVQIRETPPRRIPFLLDPAQLEAVIAALRVAVVGGASSIPSLTQRRVDSDLSGGDDDDEEGGHPNDQHICYPPIQSLEGGDARLFFVSCPMKSAPPGLTDGVSLHRHENPWILTAGTEIFVGPCELTNEITQTWVMKLKITTKLVVLCKKQLHEVNWELFEKLEEECFAEVAGQSLEHLLDVACLFSDATWSDMHISRQLTVFDALVDVLINIQGLRFSRSGEVAGIINKMVNAFKGVIQRTSNDIHSSKESSIHPATFVLIQVLDFFHRNRDMVQSILESGDYNTGPCSDIFNCFISKLKEGSEIIFEEKGQRYLFFLNNIYYVLQKNCHLGLLPPNIVSKLDSLIDLYIMSYLDEYWYPLILSYLEGDSLNMPRRSSLKKFIEEFFNMCGSQMTWKVQTVLKGILREEIVGLIVPKYVNFLKALQENPRSRWPSWLKGTLLARSEGPIYTGPQLTQVIRRLFER